MNNCVNRKEKLLETLAREIEGCKCCELKQFGGKPFVGFGNVDAKLLLIGEAPTGYAERQKRPLIGGTGNAIDKWLNYMDMRREEVYMTNAVKCVLRDRQDQVRSDGYGPYGSQLSSCKQWLQKEIEIINPMIVLTVGAAALQSVRGESICGFHEKGYCQQIEKRFYCAMYHPARHQKPLDDDDKKVLDNIVDIIKKER